MFDEWVGVTMIVPRSAHVRATATSPAHVHVSRHGRLRRADHPSADTAHVGAGLNHEVQRCRSMRAQVGELGLEHDAHRAVYVHLPLEGQADIGGNL